MGRYVCMRRMAYAAVLAWLSVHTGSAFANFFEFNSRINVGATSGIASISSTTISSPGTITLTTTNGSVVTLTANQRATVASHLNGNPNPTFGSNANYGSLGAVPAAVPVDTISIAFTYTITLSDYTAANSPLGSPNGTGDITFAGTITGDIGGGAVGLNILDLTPSPILPGQPLKGLVDVAGGGADYAAFPFAVTPPDGIVNGVLSATFTVVPEPAAAAAVTLIGLAALGLRRNRRGGAAAAAAA